MSYRDFGPQLYEYDGRPAATEPATTVLSGALHEPGTNVTSYRLLPSSGPMMVGPWCLVELFQPTEIGRAARFGETTQPAAASQQLSWLHFGELTHRDSLGNHQTLRPGRLGLLTSGSGLSHGIGTREGYADALRGVFLRVALPEAHRGTAPSWEYHSMLPVTTGQKFRATIFAGELDGMQSPATTYSPLFGADIALSARSNLRLPVQRDFEYAALVTAGTATVDRTVVGPGALLYLGMGRNELAISSDHDARLLLLGGQPLGEKLVMWRGFIAHDRDEVERYRLKWASSRFEGVPEHGAPVTAKRHTLRA